VVCNKQQRGNENSYLMSLRIPASLSNHEIDVLMAIKSDERMERQDLAKYLASNLQVLKPGLQAIVT